MEAHLRPAERVKAANTKVTEGKLLGRINAKRLPEGREQLAFYVSKMQASEFNTKTGKLLCSAAPKGKSLAFG